MQKEFTETTKEPSMKLANIAINRPVFTAMMGIAVLVLGGLALFRLGVDLFPNVSIPVVTVVTLYPGAGPEEVESQVTRPIEEAVSGINGVDEIQSYSRDSMSTVVVLFNLEADIRQTASDVKDRVGMIRGTLPRDINDPVISRIDPTAMPVLTYAVSGFTNSIETRQFIDDVIRPALERVEGVGNITIYGGDVREIRVELDRDRLEAMGLTISQVAQTIGAEGFDLPGGRLTMGPHEVGLKAVGRFRTPAEVGDVVLSSLSSQVLVSDIGRVVDGVKEARTIIRVNGIEGVTFEVQKQAGTNTVAVVNSVEKEIAKLRKQMPEGTEVVKVIDASRFIRTNIRELRNALVLGGLFAILVIFLFMLDWRSTIISAVALPTSVITSFFIMWQFGFTLNIMTMMGLSLAIGMLIDDSVVVRENIFRHLERGEDAVTAARRGTSEIALAVMATTFTIVAVFGPVAFTGGIVGRFFRQFGLTITAAVIVSLLVSFTLDPMFSSRIVQKIAPDHHARMRRHLFYGPFVRGYDILERFYRQALDWTLHHRKTVVLVAAVFFLASLFLIPFMGKEFFSQGDQGNFSVNIELPAGTSLKETDQITKRVEEIFREIPEVVTIATTVGPNEEVNKASIRVNATPKNERTRSLTEIMESVRPRLAAMPGLVYNMREAGFTESLMRQAPVTLNVRGNDYEELGRVAQQVYEIVSGTNSIRDVAISYNPGMPEQRLIIDRARAGDLGVSFAVVATTLRTAIEGAIVTKYRDGEHDIDVRVQLQPADRANLEALGAIAVPSQRGRLVHLQEVTRVEKASTPAVIERLDRERQITISANIVGRSLGEVVDEIEKKIDRIPRSSETTFRFAGEAEHMRETFANMGLALALAVIFIYFVLASQFESFLHPFTIMLSLPLAIVGALMMLFLTKHPISLPSIIGIVLLMGLVTKNAILLVDYTNQLRARGKSIIEALLEAGPTRLRPILMTSAAIILGMLPVAIGRGEGSEIRMPMAIAVIGGIITSTILTLVVVPVVYVWVDRFTLRGRRARKANDDGSEK
ncbi:efflux RND transporter permease subunit [Candidatus Poribacteria bacterium]|nr:efflux RND transporter permease subunit [Candidatus Poribacteria bacterium]